MKHKREATNGQLGLALYFPVISSPSRGGGSGTDGSPSHSLALNPTTDLYLVRRETKKLLHAGEGAARKPKVYVAPGSSKYALQTEASLPNPRLPACWLSLHPDLARYTHKITEWTTRTPAGEREGGNYGDISTTPDAVPRYCFFAYQRARVRGCSARVPRSSPHSHPASLSRPSLLSYLNPPPPCPLLPNRAQACVICTPRLSVRIDRRQKQRIHPTPKEIRVCPVSIHKRQRLGLGISPS